MPHIKPMKNLIKITVISSILFNSCLNMNEPADQAEYIEVYKQFDPALVDHIPSKLPSNNIHHSWTRLDFYEGSGKYYDNIDNHAGIFVKVITGGLENFNKLKTSFSSQAKYSFKSNDSCIVVIRTYENEIITDSITHCNEIYPVPEFASYEYSSDGGRWGRMIDNDILILDCSAGNYTKLDSIKPNKRMPLGWENGYSKGITFDNKKQTIQYWTIIW